jgi:DNA-binding NarL/FixJ family response regulator
MYKNTVLCISQSRDQSVSFSPNDKQTGAIPVRVASERAALMTPAVRVSQRSHHHLNPAIFRGLSENPRTFNGSSTATNQIGQLTSREIEVLQLIAGGLSNKQAAAKLCISIKTVEKPREHLTSKLGMHGTAALTHYAISTGIIQCNPPW